MMQTTGYVIVNDKKVLVLVRSRKLGVSLKIRKAGKDGSFLPSESEFLEVSPDYLKCLLAGQVVKI